MLAAGLSCFTQIDEPERSAVDAMARLERRVNQSKESRRPRRRLTSTSTGGARLVLATTGGALALLLLWPGAADAQTDEQLWANVTLNYIKSHRITIGLNTEPKVLLSAPDGDPGWATLDVVPSLEFNRGAWLDGVGELLVGGTRQTNHLNSTEVTPRIGLRLHLLSNLRHEIVKERRPKRRLVLRDLVRVEWRNLYYSTDKPDSSTVRFRNRFETLWPLNRQRLTDNGAAYLNADWEWFIPLDDPDERFANRQRIRAGLGYRRSYAWRFEAMYVWNRSRNTLNDPFTTTDQIIDLTMKKVW